MSESLDFNPALPESRQFTPPAEGGNGNIHKPAYGYCRFRLPPVA